MTEEEMRELREELQHSERQRDALLRRLDPSQRDYVEAALQQLLAAGDIPAQETSRAQLIVAGEDYVRLPVPIRQSSLTISTWARC